jgi:hypothetical protein
MRTQPYFESNRAGNLNWLGETLVRYNPEAYLGLMKKLYDLP